ncbi:zinc finger protein [Paecilomyces variotii]|uniref:polynucleotide adenylyltransferase n=1 Tax=Byssochlamys spectabilis TaxID=264951 RepID=A0A443HWF5_BYSSP|nr:zinc finger protein [Paecilomyces variotii]KAJ9195934.1 hypothetical protein DTO032I3_6641 [Paecilomyces variotii]KAJ9279701.1 hypothetical protein DTO021D3_3492 [Paecilomyces variotii]KAJ9347138.1 hypothetical protein DTO027B6_12 [Paecilomyces variotii]KAJ9358814.1 hypothetical protein DTO280E4_4996 [Paecilomyces variotii]KAJ9384934.1 hypothetical protein DTO032I4_4327 [Paecilomyces variotii]
MAWTLKADAPSDQTARPPLVTHQSNSLPSTPYQHPRDLSFHSRTPSPRRNSTSPRSTQSESNHQLPSFRKPLGGCKYETGMAFFRRRMPYSLGGDLLPEEKEGLKERLDSAQEEKLTEDMKEVYDRLLPSAESDDRRRQLVRKLEKLLNNQWPGSNIKVHVFGSSGNKLCSSESDVDICITTTYKELEHVCLIAEVLAKHGMERVVCVSHAKVPIVKIWDPELQLACDMNVNNTLALENTRMIRTYVDIDERVRPLAMIIKYWTKRRILNDAALGGTLSSYTWICLIINFLQTREPPILPSLQARPHKQRVTADGLVASFDDDLDSLSGFGRANKQSLGGLLFEFFRYYGHEIDYEKYVISVREGKLISKEAKGWHLLQNNRLCVEEPFNTSRNLGNTADDYSFRGLHMELRRAFKAVSEADLDQCCEQYEFPPEEERNWERPAPQPRPIITPIPPHASSRGGRGGGRGGRHSNQYPRGGNPPRRSSSAANRPSNHYRHANVGVSASDLSLQAQQAQFLLHDHLYQQIQILQAQEQELRLQLQNQALISGRPPPVLIRQPFIQFPFQQEGTGDENSRTRSGTVNHPPLTAPIRQQVFYNPAYLPVAVPAVQGSNTNPPSPSATAAIPDLRRNHRRSSVTNGSPGGSLRAHSQPARSMHSPVVQNIPSLYSQSQPVDSPQTSKQHHTPGSPGGTQGETETAFMPSSLPTMSRSTYGDESRPSEYPGYYLSTSPLLQTYPPNTIVPSFSAPVGLATQNGVPSYIRNPQEYLSSGGAASDPLSSSPDGGSVPGSKSSSSQRQSAPRPIPPRDRGPLIVDGSVPPSDHRSSYQMENFDHYSSMSHSSDENNFDTPVSTSDTLSQELQDPASFELDRQNFVGRPNPELHDASSTNDSHISPHNGRLGFLSGRLQKLHVSGSDQLDESPTKPGWDKSKTRSSPAREQINSDTRLPVGGDRTTLELSPVTECCTPSPIKRRPNGVDVDKPNGISHKSKSKGRQETANAASHSAADVKERQSESLLRKPNGVTPVTSGHDSHAPSTPNGGWQTTKKKHKRNARSSAEPRHAYLNGAEPLPVDESMRKGG